MCGRFTRNYTWAQIRALYGLASTPSNMQPSFNICPTDPVDVVVRGDDQRALVPMRWGLIPGWWKRPLKEMRVATFNARSDTIAAKKIVIVDGHVHRVPTVVHVPPSDTACIFWLKHRRPSWR